VFTRTVLHGELAAERHQTALDGGVRGPAGHPDQRVYGGHRDDHAVTGLEIEAGPHAEEGGR
jgi:hypothetical protein